MYPLFRRAASNSAIADMPVAANRTGVYRFGESTIIKLTVPAANNSPTRSMATSIRDLAARLSPGATAV